MPLFRRKTETTLSRASSISVYGQGRPQVSHNTKNPEKFSDSSSFSSLDLDDRPHPLAFAEATFDPSLPMKTKSRLSKDLGEVLSDNSALAYFIQFMEANNAKHLVKFWLEAESFRSSSETKRKDKKILPSRADDWNLLVSSSSSECVSDKSDEVFQSTSHTDSSSTEMDQNRTPDVNNVQESSSENSKNVNNIDFVPASSSFKETVRLVHTSENSSKHSKSINHNTSLDSEKEEKSVFQANSLFKDLTKDVEIKNSDHLVKCNPDVSNVYNIKFSNVQKKWEQDSKISSCSEKDLDLVKDELVKCETSIEQDANSIYCKYIAPDAPFPIGICDELRIAIENNIFKPSGDIDPHCFVPAQEFVVRKMDKEFFSNFLRSSFHCKHQIDVLTSGTVFLADVLYNDSALFFFMECFKTLCTNFNGR